MKNIKRVYHYTKFNSLLNIIKTNTFIFSDFIKANDYKEKSIMRKDEIKKYKYISFTYNKEQELYSFTNPPLWYFYAEKGHGACICFDKKILLNKITIFKDGAINYRNGITHIDNQPIAEYLMEKRKDWAYENEYRIIVDSSYNCIPNIFECITAIYIGTEISKNEIKSIYNDIPNNINIFQMYIDKTDGRYKYIDYRKKLALLENNKTLIK